MTGLTQRADDKAKKYSGGMQRRLSIAMALVSDPAVVFLDEPTIGLDPQARRGMWEYIEGLKGETTIVLTTHYLEEADALADRIAVIDDGVLVALGTPAELKARVLGEPVMIVEAVGVTDDALGALLDQLPDRRIASTAGSRSTATMSACTRSATVCDRSTSRSARPPRKHVSLDDVFLELTGKELRE